MDDKIISEPLPASNLPPDSEHETQQIVRGGVVVFGGTLIAQFVGMVVTLWVARNLGPDQYGLFSLAISILLPIATVASFGLDISLVRFLSVYSANDESSDMLSALHAALIMALVFSVIFAVAVYAASAFIGENVLGDIRITSIIQYLAVIIPLTVVTNMVSASTRGLKIMHFDAVLKISIPVSRFIFWTLSLLLVGNVLLAAIYSWLLASIVTAAISIFILFKVFGLGKLRSSAHMYKTLLSYSLPLVASSLLYALAPRIDRIILGVVADATTVGVYAVAIGLTVYPKMVHQSIVRVFSPALADSYNNLTMKNTQRLYLQATRWDAVLTFAAVVLLLLISKEIIWLLGGAYSDALLPFIILVSATYIGTVPGPTGSFLQMTNRQQVEMINAVFYLLLSISLQFWLGSKMGAIGIAVAVLCSTILFNLVQVLEIRYFYQFHPFHKNYAMFTLVTTCMLIILGFISWQGQLALRISIFCICGMLFLIALYLQRDNADVVALRSLLIKR